MKRISLTSGRAFALVDDADFDWLSKFTWQVVVIKSGVRYARRCEKFYVDRKRKSRNFYMHREILRLTKREDECDHKDGDGLNNQRSNLRKANKSQNRINAPSRNRYKGVCLISKTKKYVAQIGKGPKTFNLGTFKTPEKAAKAYDKAALRLFGEFAYLNFPTCE